MGWIEEAKTLTKEFVFRDFMEAIDFVTWVAALAEKANHHPDILIHSYKKVKIMLSTHSEGKITSKDHELAAKIDELLQD